MSTDLNMEYQEVKFGDICREVKLTTKDPVADGYNKYIGLEHLDSGSLKIKRWGLIAEDKPTFTRVFKKGHILIGKRRPYLKKAAIAEFDGICSSDIIVVESTNRIVSAELLPFFIHSDMFWDWAIKTSSGSLSPRTKFKDLSELSFKFDPSKNEAVVDILTKLYDLELNIYEAIESNQQMIRSYQFSELHDYVVTDNSQIAENIYSLKQLGNFKNGINKDKDSFGSGSYFVNLDDVFAKNEISEYPEGLVECSEKEISNYSLNKGDILFVRSSVKPSGVAKTAIVSRVFENLVYSGFLIRFRPNKPQIAEFLNILFDTPLFRHKVSAYVTVSANSNINQPSLEILKVKLPSEAMMEKICNLMGEFDEINRNLTSRTNQLHTLRKNYLYDLFK